MEFVDTVNEVNHLKKKPISVLLLEFGNDDRTLKVFMVVEDYNTVVELSLEETAITKTKFGLVYFSYSCLARDVSTLHWEDEVLPKGTEAKLGFALLLPLIEDEDNE